MAIILRLRHVTEADPARDWVLTEFYDMLVAGEVVGTVQLRLGNDDNVRLYGGHVGYGVEPQHRGHGYACQALIALCPIARSHGFEELFITCAPENIASCRTLENAGASFQGTVAVPLDSKLYARGLVLARYCLRTG